MKMTSRSALITTALFAGALIAAGDVFAQAGGAKSGRIYDPKTVETITGEIVSVDRISRGAGTRGGIHLSVKTQKETVSVHLGPSWYVEKQALKLAPKDHIEVRGSRVTVDGKPAIIAAEVKKGDQTLRLRDQDGLPLWRGQGGRPQ
jgi:hypothetical protein